MFYIWCVYVCYSVYVCISQQIHRDHVLAKTLTLHACCKLSNADISAILSLLEDEGVNMCIRKGYDYQLIDSAP